MGNNESSIGEMNSQLRFEYKNTVGYNLTSMVGILRVFLERLDEIGSAHPSIETIKKIEYDLRTLHRYTIDEWAANLDDETYRTLCRSRLAEFACGSRKLLSAMDDFVTAGYLENNDIQKCIEGIYKIGSVVERTYTQLCSKPEVRG